MKRRHWLKTIGYWATAAIVIMAGLTPVWAQTPGSSPSKPASTGKTVAGIVECGEGYTSHELYDIKITLLEVIRGKAAWKRIQAADPSNKPAADNMDYILARVRFEYDARGTPGLCISPLVPNDFTAYSAQGGRYQAASVVPPKPELRKNLKSGDSFEGWLVFEVASKDAAPLMLYSPETGGAVQHAGGKWFSLRE